MYVYARELGYMLIIKDRSFVLFGLARGGNYKVRRSGPRRDRQ